MKLLNVNIIKDKCGISIDLTDHIMKNIIQEYWGTKTKDEVKFQQSPFPVYKSFENKLFVNTHLIGEDMKQIEKSHVGSLNQWAGGLMHITVQTHYDLQYLTMHLSGYMNSPT